MRQGAMDLNTERTAQGVQLTGRVLPGKLHVQFGENRLGLTIRKFSATAEFEASRAYLRSDLVTENDIVYELQAQNQRLLEQVWALTRERDELAERLARS